MLSALPLINRLSNRTCVFLAVLVLTASPATTTARQPTEFEQYALELINRARASPNNEVNRFALMPWGDGQIGLGRPDLNEGLPPGTISSSPKQPIAFDSDLIDAARIYAKDLLEAHEFTHKLNKTSISGRIESAGFELRPRPSGAGENLAVTASSGRHRINQEQVHQHHQNLFVNRNVDGRGHRKNLMNENWQQAGIGFASSRSSFIFPCCQNAVLSVQDFAFNGSDPFLTGVIFGDLDSDRFYTPGIGEAVTDVTVDAFEAGTGQFAGSTSTLRTGGYGLQLPPGTYDVRFSGPRIDRTVRGVDIVGDRNVKLDAAPGFDSAGFVRRPGDANQDRRFSSADIIRVLGAGRYETGQRATWSQGDWNGAPNSGYRSGPPPGNGYFDSTDIIAALGSGLFETGPYAAVSPARDDVASSELAGTNSIRLTDARVTSVPEPSAAGAISGPASPCDYFNSKQPVE